MQHFFWFVLLGCFCSALTPSWATEHSRQTSSCDGLSKEECSASLLLHVPSPDWQDQIIYFLMIDRFADGNPSNNDQGAGVFNPAKESHYNGGDLQGITAQLQYIQDLGATAVWTTPQIANQWWDPLTQYTGYHGYWARDFKAVDEHYGTLADYQILSSELHKRGMYLIQDVVVNHTGNYFSYSGDYDPKDPTKNVQLNLDSKPSIAPTQFPFTQNDVTNPKHRAANIYNWTPSIQDFSYSLQETTYQTADLDDLNTKNPMVRKALKDSFGFWITQVGVDAIRIDTAKYVEPEFYQDFLHADDGLAAMAAKTGRQHFFSFAEIYQTSKPLQDNGERVLNKYVSSDIKKRIDSPIGFPLYKDINRVFAGGAPTSYLSYRLMAQMRHFSNPYLVTNFINNHDVERFLAAGNIDSFKQAYTLMMTVPGIPIIYQGDEQTFVHSRRAMFAGGYLSQEDQFDQQSQMYLFIKQLSKLRKANKVFSRGSIEILKDNKASAGVLVYKRTYQGQVAYVIFNTAKDAVLLNALQTEFNNDNPAKVLLSQNISEAINLDDSGRLTQVLPARSFAILSGEAGNRQAATAQPAMLSIKEIQSRYVNQATATVSGTVVQPGAQLLAVIDGKISGAKPLTADSTGLWQVDLPVSDLGLHQHTFELYWPEKNITSNAVSYETQSNKIQYREDKADPANDAHGPTGHYRMPLDKTFTCQMDMLNASVKAGGAVLEIELKMCDVSDMWVPPNGFDHVSFNVFFDLAPNHTQSEGANVLPIIGGVFPNQQKWDLAHMVYGWANYLYSPEGASLQQEGKKLGVAAKVAVDKENKSIRFTYNGNDFGVTSWQGTTIYISTWDKSGEGNYRELGKQPKIFSFGGAPDSSPKILDDVVLSLSAAKP